MGSGQSVRSTHFSRLPPPAREEQLPDSEDRHISISNKMVERLVEDANIAGGAAASNKIPTTPRGDYKEKIYMEKMKCLDESHSERYKITVEDLNSLATRIEMRTSNMVEVEPVCADCTQNVIDCYNQRGQDVIKCWETIDAFTTCVRDAAAARLRARTAREARDAARRRRHVAHARAQAALGPAPDREYLDAPAE